MESEEVHPEKRTCSLSILPNSHIFGTVNAKIFGGQNLLALSSMPNIYCQIYPIYHLVSVVRL